MKGTLDVVGRLLLLFSVALTSTARAQVVGASIVGTVRDSSGAALPEAKVTVRNLETGVQRTLVADWNGRYSAMSVPVGRYEVSAAKEGFSSETKTGIDLTVGEKMEVDLTLPVGEVRESVTVVEMAAPVNLSTQETSGLIDERRVKELPLNGRSYDQLMTLNAATVNYSAEKTGGVGTSNSAVGNMFAVSGHRPQENLFLLNGIEYTGASQGNITPGGTSGQLLGVDAVREFNVVSDTYGAEYGKRPGAQVSIVTASGSNELHGTMYEFVRNSALDARNYFDQGRIPQFQRNEFGGALGGPIRKNKMFLFGDYEGFRQNLGLSDVTLVPDNNARAGIVAEANGQLKNVGVAPGVAPLLSLWPVQNGPSLGGGIGEAFSHPLQRIREDFGTARYDYNLSNDDSLFAVYTVDDSSANTPTINPLSTVFETLREQVVSVQEQHVFSPTFLNTARVGFSRAGYFFTGQTPVNVPGWVAGRPIGAVVIGGGTASNGASQISLAGTNAGANLSAVRNLFTYDDHIALSHGRHQLQAGAWFQQIQANDNLAQFQYGQASFGSLTSFLQGTVSTFSVVPSPTELGWRSLEAAGFVQDSIKLTPHLEFRAGFRFESTNGWNEARGRASNYLFDANGVIQSQPVIGDSALTRNRAKFLPEPRVGLAWDPFGAGKTVINASFGVFQALLDNIDYRLDQTAPFNTTQVLKNVPVSSLNLAPGATVPKGSKISPSGIQPDVFTPTIISYTLKITQEVAPNTSLAVGYIGSHGYHEILSVDANEPFPTMCPASPCPAGLAAGTVFYPKSAPLANPNLANTTTWISQGISSYNGLEVDVNHRLTRGLQLRGVYTFSKNLDDGTAWNSSVAANAPGFVMFPLNPRLDWGLATTDVRHVAVINGSYELPLGHGKALLTGIEGWGDKLASGWTVSGIESLHSGFPFTPQLGFNPTNNGDSRNPIRPSWNPAFSGPVIVGGPAQYFNPNAFILPPADTYGNVRRDSLIGPAMAELDLSVLKNTSVSERWKLQFRAEFFNLLNHTNFSTPNTIVFASASPTPSPTAGLITATSTTSRQIQYGLKLLF
ncbi:MAG TPA: carboxypeptidase-like regulatory domain-containing protein [Terriglobales bacterium]|nr:carboxypeptidase-like regulatory domain-containing protein [Terriglobales bacterium]